MQLDRHERGHCWNHSWGWGSWWTHTAEHWVEWTEEEDPMEQRTTDLMARKCKKTVKHQGTDRRGARDGLSLRRPLVLAQQTFHVNNGDSFRAHCSLRSGSFQSDYILSLKTHKRFIHQAISWLCASRSTRMEFIWTIDWLIEFELTLFRWLSWYLWNLLPSPYFETETKWSCMRQRQQSTETSERVL